jgi:sugar phosphate isomerase/epimerase
MVMILCQNRCKDHSSSYIYLKNRHCFLEIGNNLSKTHSGTKTNHNMNTPGTINRRAFLRNAAIGAAGVGMSLPSLNAMGNRKGLEAKNKVGLYSITFLGVWYKGQALSLNEMIPKARQLGFDGIEIDGKRPHGNPLDMPAARCKEIKAKANDQGLEIYAVSGNNDFSSPVPEHRESQIVYLRELMRMTSDLGVKPLRVFLGWPGVTLHPEGGKYDIAYGIWKHAHLMFEPEQIWDWCREGLIESAKYAGDFGVTLALQNHQPVINDWKDMIRMVKEVDSPNLGACLDAPIMDDKSPENMMEAAQAVKGLQVLTHFGGEFGKDDKGQIVDIQENHLSATGKPEIKVEVYYPNFLKAMKSIGYNGWYSYELCHPLPVVDGQRVGIEFVEDSARNACTLMKTMLKEVQG